MKAVILAGGLGTRLSEETAIKPKPMVEIGGKPILWHLMRIYYRHGFRRFVLCLGYKGNLIKQYFLNYSAMQNDFTLKLRSGSQQLQSDSENIEDWEITFADTGTDTNTGGRLSRIRHLIKEQHFLANYLSTKPGSAARGKQINTIISLGVKVSESGAAEKSLDGITDEELESEINATAKALLMFNPIDGSKNVGMEDSRVNGGETMAS